MAKKKIPAAAMRAIRGEGGESQLSRIVDYFVAIVGGERKFARLMFEAYQDDRATPATRQRIIDTILRGLQFANSRQPPADDLGLASDDDLLRELKTLVEKMDEKNAGAEDES